MTAKRFTETVSTGDVHDTFTGKDYRCEYRIDDEFLELVNNIAKENEELKSKIIAVIDRKIKNNDSNPPKDFQTYSKVNRALKDVRESLRDVIEEY